MSDTPHTGPIASKLATSGGPNRKPPNAGKGRPKGIPNKLTKAFKAAVLSVYDGIGGDATFMAWAQENQTEFYKIAARLIPHDVEHSGEIRLPRVVDELHAS